MKLVGWSRRVMQGKLNVIGTFELPPSTAAATITDPRLTTQSFVDLMATNSAGGVLLGAGHWIDTQRDGSARVTFQSTGAATAGFKYMVIG